MLYCVDNNYSYQNALPQIQLQGYYDKITIFAVNVAAFALVQPNIIKDYS